MQHGSYIAIAKLASRFLLCLLIASLMAIVNKGWSQQVDVAIHFTPDCWGNESSWMLVDESNDKIAQSHTGTYLASFPNPIEEQITKVQLEYGACYSFIVLDTQGDGIAGSIWESCISNGTFSILSAPGDTITKMKTPNFGGVHSDRFCLEYGCTNQLASNYNPDATLNDGSCKMPGVLSNFDYEIVSNNCEFVTYQFKNSSTGASAFEWVFSNGIPSSSLESEPVVTFPSGIMCAVSLKAYNEAESHTHSKKIQIHQPEPGTSVTLVIQPDCFAEDIAWELNDENGNSIRHIEKSTYPNHFPQNNILIEEPFCLSNGCYTFSIKDDYGDGLKGSRFKQCLTDGNYYFRDANNNTILAAEDIDFGKSASHEFCIDQLFVWNGEELASWDNAQNWDGKKVPGKNDNVVIDSPGTSLVLNTDITVNTLTISAGSNVSMDNSSRKIRLHGDLINNGNLDLSTGMIVVEGNKLQHFKGINTPTLSKLYVDTQDTIRLLTDINVNGAVIMKQGVFDINGKDLTLIANNDQQGVIAEIQDEATFVGDTITFERYYPAAPGAWRMICTPIEGATFNAWNDDFPTTGFVGADYPDYPTAENPSSNILMYDETVVQGEKADLNVGFTPIEHIEDQIDPNKGYFVYFVPSPTTLDVRGKFIQGDVKIPLEYTSSGGDHAHDGWNLIANPYPCAINWDEIARNQKTGLHKAIYAFDPENGQYSSYVGGVSIGNLSNRIDPGQAFWVKSTGENAEILFTEKAKTPEQGVHMPKINLNTEALLRIRISKENFKDDCVIGFNTEATSEFDAEMDAYKFYPTDNNLPSIAVVPDQKTLSMSISMLPVPDQDMIIPLELNTGNYTEMYISNLEIDSYDEDYCFMLEDSELNKTVAFNKGQVYHFNVTQNTKPDRFKLHVKAQLNTAVIHEGCPDNLSSKISTSGFGKAPWNFTWKDEMGNIIQETKKSNKPDVLKNLTPGYYQLEVKNRQKTCHTAVKIIEVEAPVKATLRATGIPATCNHPELGSIELDLVEGLDWNFILKDENGFTIHDYTGRNEDFSIENLNPETYFLQISNKCDQTQQIEHIHLSDPHAVESKIVCDQTLAYLENGGVVRFVASVNNADETIWDFGDETANVNGLLVQHAYDSQGTFLATLVAKNEHCTDSSSQEIKITSIHSAQDQHPVSKEGNLTDVSMKVFENNLAIEVVSPLEEACQFAIYTMNGGMVYTQSKSPSEARNCELDITNLSTGMYYLHVTSANQLLHSETFLKK